MKMPIISWVVWILMVNLVSPKFLRGQEAGEADRLYEAERWEAASQAYGAIVGDEPTNAPAWFRLGVCLRHLGRYGEAAEAFSKAEQNGSPVQFVGYEMAATHALRGNEEQAFEWLEKALEAGFSQPAELENDEAFLGLREDTRFHQFIRKADVNARPCELLPEYGQFDFWVGDWEVSADGRIAGTNTIQKMAEGCALLENWVGAGGGTGKSVNYYDPRRKKWIQVWIDSGGGVIQAEGGLAVGSMRFEGQHVYRNGRQEDFRMTFTPREDGGVRQFIEQSKDKGKTWYVWFDGTYTRRK